MASMFKIIAKGCFLVAATVAIWMYVQTEEVNLGIGAIYIMTCAIAIGQE